jgi:hypothetical protein
MAIHEFDGVDRVSDRQLGGAAILDGDASTGPILTVVDEEANYGIEAYRELIDELHEAGLHVYAINGAGNEYDAEWEYRAPGKPPRSSVLSEAAGESVITARCLLAESRQRAPDASDLAGVDDTILADAARRLLAEPGVPKAVLEAI